MNKYMQKSIFLDNNSTTAIFPNVLEEVITLLTSVKFLNPSSVHLQGKKAKEVLDEAKREIILNLNAKCHEVYFTSGATEANNMALNCANFAKIFSIKTEHDSILTPLAKLPHEFILIDSNGIVNLNDLQEKIKFCKSSNFLCSISYINNESGVIQDISAISKIVHENGGLMHSDVSQFIGKQRFDFNLEDIDIITFTGHKFHAGMGCGVAIFKSGIDILPFILGGGQQNFKRAGTENIPAIFALSKALKIVNSNEYLLNYHSKTLTFQRLIEDVAISFDGEVFAKNVKRVSNTSFIAMRDVNNFVQMMEFDLNNICISTGSACSSGKTNISHVLKACGVSEDRAKNFIRVSTSGFNELFEIEKFVEVWQKLSKQSLSLK